MGNGKRRTLMMIVAAVLATLALPRSASATFTGVSVHFHSAVNISGFGQAHVWRLYANFSNPQATTQSVGAWGGSPAIGATTIQQILPNGNPGTGFYNHEQFGGTLAPWQVLVDFAPDLQWDTFATIGLAIQPGTGGSITQAPAPGFPAYLFEGTGGTNNNFSTAAGGQPTFSMINAQGRVLLAQFTVHAGEYVRGVVGFVAGFHETGLAGLTTFSHHGGTFNPPTPGTLALFGVAGLAGPRRRRLEN